jgi:hypothetical protein
MVASISVKSATSEQGFFLGLSCPKGTRYTFVLSSSRPMYYRVDGQTVVCGTAMTEGPPFLMCALYARVTQVSVMPFAIFAIVLPVQGAIYQYIKQLHWDYRLRAVYCG